MKQLWSVWPTQVTQCILMLEHTSAANMLRCSHILTLQKYVQSKIWGLSFKHIVNKSLHCMNSLKRSILLDPAPTLRPSINCFCLFNPGSHSSTQLPIHSPLFPFFSPHINPGPWDVFSARVFPILDMFVILLKA